MTYLLKLESYLPDINFIGFKYKPTTYGKGGIFSTSGKPL